MNSPTKTGPDHQELLTRLEELAPDKSLLPKDTRAILATIEADRAEFNERASRAQDLNTPLNKALITDAGRPDLLPNQTSFTVNPPLSLQNFNNKLIITLAEKPLTAIFGTIFVLSAITGIYNGISLKIALLDNIAEITICLSCLLFVYSYIGKHFTPDKAESLKQELSNKYLNNLQIAKAIQEVSQIFALLKACNYDIDSFLAENQQTTNQFEALFATQEDPENKLAPQELIKELDLLVSSLRQACNQTVRNSITVLNDAIAQANDFEQTMILSQELTTICSALAELKQKPSTNNLPELILSSLAKATEKIRETLEECTVFAQVNSGLKRTNNLIELTKEIEGLDPDSVHAVQKGMIRSNILLAEQLETCISHMPRRTLPNLATEPEPTPDFVNAVSTPVEQNS